MNKKLKFLHKGLSLITGLLLVFQSLSPGLFALKNYAFAQEEEPTPTVTEEPTPTAQPTATPTAQVTPEITAEPTVTPTPIVEEVTPTPQSSEPPHETSPPTVEEAQSNPVVESASTEQGQLHASLLNNVEADTLNLDAIDPSSATLTTDKGDYAPTDTAIITGTAFTPSETYALTIGSNDEPPTSTTVKVDGDENGAFVYAYQLDGMYRPSYFVQVFNTKETLIASTTFTDSATVNSATLNGATSITVAPGQTITAAVNATAGSANADKWKGTGWLISTTPPGSTTCANTDDHTNTTATESFSVTAPTAAGTYNAYFRTYSDNGCTNDPSSLITLTNAVTVLPTPSWPTSWTTPGTCATDPSGESGVSPTEIDLVGSTGTPAVGFASDSNYFYFRERINGNPGTESTLHQYSWVVLFQTSNPQYQYLGVVSGKSGNKVLLYDNPTHAPDAGGVDFSPLFNDPADSVLWEAPSSIHGRVTGSGPYYIDWAIPVAELTSRGINVSTTKFFATSTNANNYNKDHLQCYEVLSDVSVTKSDSPDPVTNGGTLTYTLNIHNAGPDTASGVVVTDTLPVGYAVTSVTPSQGSCSDTSEPSIQCELGSMSNGANATITIVGTITTNQTTVTNNTSVTLDTTVSTDTNPSNDTDSEDTTVNPATGTLRVIKVVTNDNGGNLGADSFSFSVNGDPAIAFESDGQNDLTVNTGTYSVSEPTVTGYTTTYDNCSNITVTTGGTTTCTITNNDQPATLNINKQVINDNGGTKTASDFSFQVNGGSVQPFDADGQNEVSVNAGTYTVTEPSVTGYTTSYNNCSNIVLVNGQTQTCYVTNNDISPLLTVTKVVTNDNGGTAGVSYFPLFVNATQVTSGVQNAFNAGNYIISETSQSGYTQTIGGDCDAQGNITLAVGDVKSCTITNNDEQATLTLVKNLPNDNGGQVTEGDFNVYIDGTPTSWGTQTLDAGTYTVSEDTLPGYTPSAWAGDCDENGNVTLLPGDQKTCEITNDDEPATLTLTKILPNDNGGTATQDNFPVYIDEEETDWGTQPIDAGNYVISEDTMPGYLASGWGGDCDSEGNISILPGENKTCTIVNDDVEPKLTVTKVVSGGNATVSDFPLFVDQTEVTSGVQNGFSAGTYTVSETNQTGYTTSFSGDCAADGNVTLNPGDEKTCTITNTRDQGTLTVHKVVGDTINPAAFSWGTASDQTNTAMGNGVTLDTGSYDVFENTVSGYQFTGWFYGNPRENEFSCQNPQFTSAPTNIDVSTQGKELTLCNKLQNPILTISKTNDAAGDKNPGDSVLFTIVVTATQSAVFNVKVTDLAAGGFAYRAGSWTAKKNGVPVAVSEPVYASPGVWSIGDMNVGDIVELTYRTDISADQKPGLYKDLVWATGDNVLAMAINPGFVSDNFAGTQVNVVKEQQSSSSINVEHKEEVLGASTELPATGANSTWLILAAMLFLSGTAIIIVGRRYA